MFDAIINAPFGKFGIRTNGAAVTGTCFLPGQTHLQSARGGWAAKVVILLQRYFADSRVPLNLPLVVQGSVFQRKVWRALQALPVGETRSYGQLAKGLQSSARAVGNACRHNPLPVLIPCHRIVAQSGLGGFSGAKEGEMLGCRNKGI